MSAGPQAQRGRVVSSFGRHVVIEDADGAQRLCHPKGKKNAAVVGDWVLWTPSADEGRIVSVEARDNLLFRQDEWRTKMFAANLDQVVVFLGATPEFSERQLARALIACEAAHLAVRIVLNKHDLHDAFARAWVRLEPYTTMGYAVLPLSLEAQAPHGLENLQAELRGRVSLILGPSGAGKSSLINRLVPDAQVLTQQISQALNSGKHTTTTSTWHWLDAAKTGALIDSPGFQEFGLNHIERGQLPALMPDIAAHTGHCKYYNCTHRQEPGCGVRAAVDQNSGERPLSAGRYRLYLELFDAIGAPGHH